MSRFVCVLASLLTFIGTAAAEYPERSITIIVPFAAGGPSDVMARILADRMRSTLGQFVVVENVTGAGGSIGVTRAVRSPPDGYTISFGHLGTHVFNGAIYPLTFDLLTDLEPVAMLPSNPMVIVSKNDVPAKTLKEFIALAKAKPGTLNYASAGLGSTAYVSAELFKSVAQVNIVHVPYKGLPEALTDTMTGRVQMYFLGIVGGLPHIQAGRVRALAVSTPKRAPALQEVPTMEEAGLPGFDYDAWFGLLTSAKVPRPMVARLHRDVVRVLDLADVRARLSGAGADPTPNSPEQFDALIRADAAKLGKILRDAGIQPQ